MLPPADKEDWSLEHNESSQLDDLHTRFLSIRRRIFGGSISVPAERNKKIGILYLCHWVSASAHPLMDMFFLWFNPIYWLIEPPFPPLFTKSNPFWCGSGAFEEVWGRRLLAQRLVVAPFRIQVCRFACDGRVPDPQIARGISNPSSTVSGLLVYEHVFKQSLGM